MQGEVKLDVALEGKSCRSVFAGDDLTAPVSMTTNGSLFAAESLSVLMC
jgi:hypothetical protein